MALNSGFAFQIELGAPLNSVMGLFVQVMYRMPFVPGPTFIKPDQLDPWIKDQMKITLLSTFSPLQLPNFVSCGRDKPSHLTQNCNCRDKIVDSRAFLSWSLIHGSSWSGLIKVGPGTSHRVLLRTDDYNVYLSLYFTYKFTYNTHMKHRMHVGYCVKAQSTKYATEYCPSIWGINAVVLTQMKRHVLQRWSVERQSKLRRCRSYMVLILDLTCIT